MWLACAPIHIENWNYKGYSQLTIVLVKLLHTSCSNSFIACTLNSFIVQELNF